MCKIKQINMLETTGKENKLKETSLYCLIFLKKKELYVILLCCLRTDHHAMLSNLASLPPSQ